jgi:HNH endonuclease
MKRIQLTRGYFALVDDEDYDRVMTLKWHVCIIKATGRKYAAHNYKKRSRSRDVGVLLMHRFILNAPEGIEVDHRDGNALDNRRKNIRLATHAQNMANRPVRSDSTNGYKGVRKDGSRWLVRIRIDGKMRHFGSFATIKMAANTYNELAKKIHGDFARLNLV